MMRALLEERVSQLKGRPGCEFSDDVRLLLRTRLTSNHCLADKIAHLLAMHRRTLSRRLKGSGMSYRLHPRLSALVCSDVNRLVG
jgi:hypothetical protein